MKKGKEDEGAMTKKKKEEEEVLKEIRRRRRMERRHVVKGAILCSEIKVELKSCWIFENQPEWTVTVLHFHQNVKHLRNGDEHKVCLFIYNLQGVPLCATIERITDSDPSVTSY